MSMQEMSEDQRSCDNCRHFGTACIYCSRNRYVVYANPINGWSESSASLRARAEARIAELETACSNNRAHIQGLHEMGEMQKRRIEDLERERGRLLRLLARVREYVVDRVAWGCRGAKDLLAEIDAEKGGA